MVNSVHHLGETCVGTLAQLWRRANQVMSVFLKSGITSINGYVPSQWSAALPSSEESCPSGSDYASWIDGECVGRVCHPDNKGAAMYRCSKYPVYFVTLGISA